jgi:hypothetical protein
MSSSQISFELDAMSAAEVGASWQAEQLESIVAGRREIARVEAAEVRMLAQLLLEAEGSAGEDCLEAGDPAAVTRLHDLKVRSIATELAASVNCTVQAAEQRLGEAWALANELFETLGALESGDISRAHAHEIIFETAHLTEGRVAAEAALLPWAKSLPVSAFRRKAKQVLETLEHESLRVRHERAFAKRRVTLAPGRDGMAHLDAYLDLVDAARVKAGLENAASEARQAGDSRTAAQLQADFTVELLLDGQVTVGNPDGDTAANTVAVKGRAPVSLDVLIPAATLAGVADEPAHLPGLGAIDPVRARELVALAPSLKRILTDPVTGAVVEFDRRTYRVPAELKRVLRLRDGHCRAPGCTAPLPTASLTTPRRTARAARPACATSRTCAETTTTTSNTRPAGRSSNTSTACSNGARHRGAPIARIPNSTSSGRPTRPTGGPELKTPQSDHPLTSPSTSTSTSMMAATRRPDLSGLGRRLTRG